MVVQLEGVEGVAVAQNFQICELEQQPFLM